MLQLRRAVPAHREALHEPLDVVTRSHIVDQLYVTHLLYPVDARHARGTSHEPAVAHRYFGRVLDFGAAILGHQREVGIEDVEHEATALREMCTHVLDATQLVVD